MPKLELDYRPHGEFNEVARVEAQLTATDEQVACWRESFALATLTIGLVGEGIEHFLAALYANPYADPELIDKAAKSFAKGLGRLYDATGHGGGE
jgi:hypothetical protein